MEISQILDAISQNLDALRNQMATCRNYHDSYQTLLPSEPLITLIWKLECNAT
jgi:hypothetical protein